MTGLALWANAGPNARQLFIRIACDGDLHASNSATGYRLARRLTVAQALEMVK